MSPTLDAGFSKILTMLKTEAVIICVNYSDFLSITLPQNKKVIDRILVVTKDSDFETINLCKKLQVEYIVTDAFNYNGASFNKGLAINVGFSQLKLRDWIINLDADILLPDNFSETVSREMQNIECSYSCRRYDIPTFKEWLEVMQNRELIKTKKLYRGIGYGNFFCFNFNSSIFQKSIGEFKGLPYPYWFSHASESDWIFRNRWSDWIYDPPLNDNPHQHEIENRDRAEHPEFLKELSCQVIHLGETGRNALSRVTPEFK